MRRVTAVTMAAALGGLAMAASGQAPAPAPGATPLPAGPGHDTLVRVCSACHAPEIVTQQRLTKDGWHELVQTMIANGAQGSDPEFAEIETYLNKNFPDQPAAK